MNITLIWIYRNQPADRTDFWECDALIDQTGREEQIYLNQKHLVVILSHFLILLKILFWRYWKTYFVIKVWGLCDMMATGLTHPFLKYNKSQSQSINHMLKRLNSPEWKPRKINLYFGAYRCKWMLQFSHCCQFQTFSFPHVGAPASFIYLASISENRGCIPAWKWEGFLKKNNNTSSQRQEHRRAARQSAHSGTEAKHSRVSCEDCDNVCINRKYKELHWRAQSAEAHQGLRKRRRRKSVQAAAFLEELSGISANWVKVNLHFKVQLSLNQDTKGRQGIGHLKLFVQREQTSAARDGSGSNLSYSTL